jgi:hypothetical protein
VRSRLTGVTTEPCCVMLYYALLWEELPDGRRLLASSPGDKSIESVPQYVRSRLTGVTTEPCCVMLCYALLWEELPDGRRLLASSPGDKSI